MKWVQLARLQPGPSRAHKPVQRLEIVLALKGAVGRDVLLEVLVLTEPAITVRTGTPDVGVISPGYRATGRQEEAPTPLSPAANPAAARTLNDIDAVLRGVQDPAARKKLLGISRQLRGKVASEAPCTVTDPVTGKCLL